MKKINLENYKKRLDVMQPNYIHLGLFLGGLGFTALGLDLELQLFVNFNASVFLMSLVYFLCWLIDSIIYICIKKKRLKNESTIKHED